MMLPLYKILATTALSLRVLASTASTTVTIPVCFICEKYFHNYGLADLPPEQHKSKTASKLLHYKLHHFHQQIPRLSTGSIQQSARSWRPCLVNTYHRHRSLCNKNWHDNSSGRLFDSIPA